MLSTILSTSLALPLTDPVLKFLIILVIILAAPLLLNRLKVPQLLGLIIAGALIGPYGFNIMLRDSGIIMSGTAGLLYIMFLAGLEIDLDDFRNNSWRSLVFGLFTFCIPMGLGYLAGRYVLGFSDLTSILLASMFASHTLITYPIVSKSGISRNPAVSLTVGGTMITDTLALLTLAIVVGLSTGETGEAFWIRLGAGVTVFALLVMIVFPIVGRWFFKRVDDRVSQYIFVLALVFLGAFLVEIAGLEAIIGAFLVGMALNRLIPNTSPLMNRIDFVGNAIFIPFFLISVGMIVDYRAFFTSWETITVGVVMIAIAIAAKWIAAWFTQKSFRMSRDQRNIIFGLSNSQAAATLAAVTVGYNIILGYTDDGLPIRLLSDSILNGTILMILVTCTVSSFATQRGARNIALSEVDENPSGADDSERILFALAGENTAKESVYLGTAIKTKNKHNRLYALEVVDNDSAGSSSYKSARKALDMAIHSAAATDNPLEEILRYDINRNNAVRSVVLEKNITDVIISVPMGDESPLVTIN